MKETLQEYLFSAHEELKRLEHIIYVSLKYTRTVDVILNALNRLVNVYDVIIEAFLLQAKENGTISSLPKSPALRATRLAELYAEDKELQNYLTFYHFLKGVLKSPSTRREEYRRHVALVVELDRSTAEIDIDNLTNCERFVHNFFHYARRKILGINQEEEEDL